MDLAEAHATQVYTDYSGGCHAEKKLAGCRTGVERRHFERRRFRASEPGRSPAPVASAPPTNNVPPPAMAANANNVSDPMATKDPDQVICLNEKLTGSMLPTRVCQTRRNWIKQSVNSREVIEHLQNVGSGQPGGN
jgi:hypothetical protein